MGKSGWCVQPENTKVVNWRSTSFSWSEHLQRLTSVENWLRTTMTGVIQTIYGDFGDGVCH